MAKKKIKFRRKLSTSDFRKAPRSKIVDLGEHGSIDTAAIERAFPDEEKRREYIQFMLDKLKE